MDSLGDRMKSKYEDCYRITLPGRMPLIVRIDGKAFHSFTKKCDKPWDLRLRDAMTAACQGLIKELAGAKIAYCQSDEISVLLTDYDSLNTSAYFDKNLQKIVSVSASIATAHFNRSFNSERMALFDARAFVVPKEDVCNYFLWRQQDATRNSIMGLAQEHFPSNRLHKVNRSIAQEMLFKEKGINWNDCEIWQKRGWCVVKKIREIEENMIRPFIEPDWEIPIFSQNRNYIDQFVFLGEQND